MKYHILEGSERLPPTAEKIGDVPKDQLVTLTIVVHDDLKRGYGSLWGRAVAAVRRAGLQVTFDHPGTKTIHATASAGYLQKTFKTKLHRYRTESGIIFRGRSGPLALPELMHKYAKAVLGVDNRPAFEPDVVSEYEKHGAGKSIGLIEFGGCLKRWFPSNDSITAIGPQHSTQREATAHVRADVGALVRARLAIYFTPNTNRGHYDAMRVATLCDHDAVVMTWRPIEEFPPTTIAALESLKSFKQQPLLEAKPIKFTSWDDCKFRWPNQLARRDNY